MGKVRVAWLRRGRLELGKTRVPSRGVVVLGVEAFQPSLLKEQYHRDALRAGLAVLDPGERVAASVVEFFYDVAIVSKVRPAEIRQHAGSDQCPEITGRTDTLQR